MNKKGFTLIELLVVVAIIGILAAVGLVAFNGFIDNSKATATKNQHKEIVKYIKLGMVECDLEGGTITLLDYRGEETSFSCSTDPGVWRNAYNAHFHGLDWTNAYSTPNPWDNDSLRCCLPDNGDTWLKGITALGAQGSYVVINTDVDGIAENRLSDRILDYRLR